MWSDTRVSLPKKKEKSIQIIKRTNVDIKINTKPSSSAPEIMPSTDKEKTSKLSDIHDPSVSTSNTTGTDIKSDNPSSSLSLLNAYSSSSDNDSG